MRGRENEGMGEGGGLVFTKDEVVLQATSYQGSLALLQESIC